MTLLPLAVLLLAAEGGGGHDNLMLWRIVNFLILGGLIGYLIRKNAGPFFAGRSESIARELAESRKLIEESEARARAIDGRLSRLGQEIEQLRAGARTEIAAEHARLEQETAHAVRKVSALAELEITSAGKAARQELKAYTAGLAVELAAQKIRDRITPDTQRALVGSFVRNL